MINRNFISFGHKQFKLRKLITAQKYGHWISIPDMIYYKKCA